MSTQKVCEGKGSSKVRVKFSDGRTEDIELGGGAEIEIVRAPVARSEVMYTVKGIYTNMLYNNSNFACNTTREWSSIIRGKGIRIGRYQELGTWYYGVGNEHKEGALMTDPTCAFQGMLEKKECFFYELGTKAVGQNPKITALIKPDGTEEPPGFQINIYDADGNLIYSSTSEDEIKYEVGCDEDCPPQTMKCNSNAYPGFKCVPCRDLLN